MPLYPYSAPPLMEHVRRHFAPHGLVARIRAVDFEPFPPRKRRRGPDDPGTAVPVRPDRPTNLSGGTAAEMKFDDSGLD